MCSPHHGHSPTEQNQLPVCTLYSESVHVYTTTHNTVHYMQMGGWVEIKYSDKILSLHPCQHEPSVFLLWEIDCSTMDSLGFLITILNSFCCWWLSDAFNTKYLSLLVSNTTKGLWIQERRVKEGRRLNISLKTGNKQRRKYDEITIDDSFQKYLKGFFNQHPILWKFIPAFYSTVNVWTRIESSLMFKRFYCQLQQIQ